MRIVKILGVLAAVQIVTGIVGACYADNLPTKKAPVVQGCYLSTWLNSDFNQLDFENGRVIYNGWSTTGGRTRHWEGTSWFRQDGSLAARSDANGYEFYFDVVAGGIRETSDNRQNTCHNSSCFFMHKPCQEQGPAK
jgi:hypothetical protein